MDEESIRVEIAQQIQLALEDLKKKLTDTQKEAEKETEEEQDSFKEYMKTVKGLKEKEN